jgi:hypothetical protein
MANLIDGLQEEMNRCRELLKQYEAIPEGVFGATMIKQTIKRSEQSISSGDVVEMLIMYEELKEING